MEVISMKVGIIGAGTMGQGIAKAFAQVDGYEVALCDIRNGQKAEKLKSLKAMTDLFRKEN
jgi:3-hydroxybutyryl-CoA dehydrogenase